MRKTLTLRPARATDQPIIDHLIHDVGINPMSLDWHRFVIAEDEGLVIGVGLIKPHRDGSRELASIAVIPERRGQGIARQIIEHLLAQESETLYLTCRSQLESFYARFGFRRIEPDAMPPYFRRMIRLANLFSPLMRGVQIIVMKRQ